MKKQNKTKHCELSQLQNLKNSKQPSNHREKKEQPGEYDCRFITLYSSNLSKPASSGFTKGKYTLDMEPVESKIQLCIRIRFHAAFLSQHNLEVKQQQTTEANGGGRAGTQEELYCTLLVCCCQSLCASQFIWQISARITLLYNFKDILPFLQITNLKLIPKSKPFILQYFNFTLPYFGSFSALRLLK